MSIKPESEPETGSPTGDSYDILYKMFQYLSELPNVPTAELDLDPDTKYKITFEIYMNKYIYFLMKETTALAPFYYNKSFLLEDLFNLNSIFKTCDTLEEVKNYIIELFSEKKIKLKKGEDEKVIYMEIDAILFCKKRVIKLEMLKENIPDSEKDKTLLQLYTKNKKMLKKLKEIYSILSKDKKNNREYQYLIDNILAMFNNKNLHIPGLEIESINKPLLDENE